MDQISFKASFIDPKCFELHIMSCEKGADRMPVFAIGGAVNSNTPQQNAIGVTIGQYTSNGWDANMKFNAAEGGNSALCSLQMTLLNLTFDDVQMSDGTIDDRDRKLASGSNV